MAREKVVKPKPLLGFL